MSLSGVLASNMMRGTVIDMNDKQLATVAVFTVAPGERYDFIARILRRFGYRRLLRADKGVVLRFQEGVSGYSRQRLIWRCPLPAPGHDLGGASVKPSPTGR